MLEQRVFELPADFGVMFWRARIDAERLQVEIEVDQQHAGDATDQLRALLDGDLAAPCEVLASAPGTIVPESALGSSSVAGKPRMLFDADQDWNDAVVPAG